MESASNLPQTKKPKVSRSPKPLSDAMIRALEPGDYRQADAKVRHLKVRVRPGGKSFIFDYKPGPLQRTITLGDVGMGIAAARKAAEKLNARLAMGEDPAADRDAKRTESANTVGAVLKLHLAHQRLQLRSDSYKAHEHHLLTHGRPLHRLPLQAVTRRDIAACITGITLKGAHVGNGNATRKNLTRAISRLFTWCIEQGLIDANPAIGLSEYKVPPRERVLSLEELRLIWLAAPANDFGRIIKLLMLTGAREAEIAKLQRGELRDDAILLPSARTKNGLEFLIPLAPAARAIIDDQLTIQDPDRELVFGRRGSGPFGDWSKSKKRLDVAIEAQRGATLAPWRIHDLRRSFATHAGESREEGGIEVEPHIVEAVLNHRSGFRAGVASTYNHQKYEPQKRAALNRWAEHLLAFIEGRKSNVLPMKREA